MLSHIAGGVNVLVNTGVGFINTVRAYQGSGVAALPNGLTLAQAMQELTMERGAALAFRALSFLDSRRWGLDILHY